MGAKRKNVNKSVGIRIGHTPGVAEGVGSSVAEILRAGFKYHLDQATIVAALNAFRDATSINHTTVSGSTITMGAKRRG